MKTYCFLVAAAGGIKRMTQTQPKLHPGEVAMRVEVELPDVLFQAPLIKAAITIPESMVQAEPISADVQENIVGAIRANTGLEVRLIVEPLTEEEAGS